MALSTLTNVRTIMGLGPHKSILGTIIRPDSVLLERKGGSNGEVTFNSLLPGAGEPGDQQEIVGNWQFGNAGEEPFPRGNGLAGDGSTRSSGKKRKSPKEKVSKKVKENGDVRHKENGSRKDKSVKRRGDWQHDNSNGFDRYAVGCTLSHWSY